MACWISGPRRRWGKVARLWREGGIHFRPARNESKGDLMAKIQTNSNESVWQIKNWLGVNEAPEGQARLKTGEAAAMRNFRITAGGALKKRGGSVNVAGLMQSYNVVQDGTEALELFRETGKSDLALTLYPRAGTDSVGVPKGEGTPVTAGCSQAEDYAGYYYQAEAGGLYRLQACVHTAAEKLREFSFTTGGGFGDERSVWLPLWDDPPVFHDGAWDTENAVVTNVLGRDFAGKYSVGGGGSVTFPGFYIGFAQAPDIGSWDFNGTGEYIQVTEAVWEQVSLSGYSLRIKRADYQSPVYSWRFYPQKAVGNGADSVVRGLWSGFVGEAEVLCAACNGYLWQLRCQDGVWSKTACGALDTSRDVRMFGFDGKLYLLNGSQYKVWDGTVMAEVAGYRPLVSVAAAPAGGGTALEQANKLTGAKRCRFSPDGEATDFYLPEAGIASVDYVKDLQTGAALTGWTAETETGKLTFSAAPEKGVSSLEVGWTHGTCDAAAVRAMRYMELYNGAQDSRVFLYGDGTNQVLYSGLDENGRPRADYFPDLNAARVGDENTPVTALIRHYGKLLAFKLDSAWVIAYDSLTLEDGLAAAGFTVTPVNRSVGNCAPGQALLVENQPRTLDGRSVIEWRTAAGSSLSGDERNARRISQRVDASIRAFDLTKARTFYDKYAHEYYVIGGDGTALVHGIDADAWYIYTDFAASCLIRYRDELYFGTGDGWLRHFTDAAFSDAGQPIDCRWESGAMPFGRDWRRKYSAMLWVGVKPESGAYLRVTAQTDRKADFAEYSFSAGDAGALPRMQRIRLKAKKFTYYKLVLENHTADRTATVVSAGLRIRDTGYVR